MQTLFDAETRAALTQLIDETTEALQLAKQSPDLDDFGATLAVAFLKLGMATGFVEQRHPGFARDVEEKRQRVLAALVPRH
jgi:glucuronate isomerase